MLCYWQKGGKGRRGGAEMEWMLIWLLIDNANINPETGSVPGHEYAHWVFRGKDPFADCVKARTALVNASKDPWQNKSTYHDVFICIPVGKK